MCKHEYDLPSVKERPLGTLRSECIHCRAGLTAHWLDQRQEASLAAAPEMLAACEAAIAYDAAIASCANDPRNMASLCSAQGDDLDSLYDKWITAARVALAKATGGQS